MNYLSCYIESNLPLHLRHSEPLCPEGRDSEEWKNWLAVERQLATARLKEQWRFLIAKGFRPSEILDPAATRVLGGLPHRACPIPQSLQEKAKRVLEALIFFGVGTDWKTMSRLESAVARQWSGHHPYLMDAIEYSVKLIQKHSDGSNYNAIQQGKE